MPSLRYARTWLPASILVGTLTFAGPNQAAEPACEFDSIERIVAVGDVHGAYEQFREILQVAGVTD